MWNWAAWPSLEQLRPTTPAMPIPYSLKHSHTRPLSFRHPTAYYAVTPSSVYAFLDPVPPCDPLHLQYHYSYPSLSPYYDHYYYHNYNYKWRLILLIVSSYPRL